MEAASVAVKPKRRRSSGGFSEGRLGAAMMAPSLVVMALVAAFPIGYAIWLSLHEYSVRVPGLSRWSGFGNYSEALWGDTSSQFWEAFRNTFIFTGVSMVSFCLCSLPLTPDSTAKGNMTPLTSR